MVTKYTRLTYLWMLFLERTLKSGTERELYLIFNALSEERSLSCSSSALMRPNGEFVQWNPYPVGSTS